MRFGLVPREWGEFKGEAIEQSVLGEKLGFHSIWVEEHHGNKYYLPSPLIALAGLSQHVPKMHLGTAIAVLPLYHPVRFASDGAILDHLCNGKFIAGVGVGYRKEEFDIFNSSFANRSDCMEEQLTIIKSLWEGRKLNFNGRFYKIDDFELEPKPIQKPRPPIWIGGWVKRAIVRAARLGDRWFPGPVGTLSYVLEGTKIYREALSWLQKKFEGISLMREAYVAHSEDEALRDIEEPVRHMYGEDYSRTTHPLLTGGGSGLQEWVKDRFLVGTAEQVTEQVAKLQKEGVDYLVLRSSLRELPHKKVMESLRLFGGRVIPYFAEPQS